MRQCWQNPRRSGWPEARSDEVGQVWNGGLVWDGEPSAQGVPERPSELLAGFHQAQEHIPAIPAHVAAGSAADLAPGHLGPDVVLRSVGVERDLGAVEHPEQSLWPARRSSRKFSRLLLAVVPNQAKWSLPICVQVPFAALWRAPGPWAGTPAGGGGARVSPPGTRAACASPARSTPRASSRKRWWPSISKRMTCRVEI